MSDFPDFVFWWVGASICIGGGIAIAIGLLFWLGDWAIRRANYAKPFLEWYFERLKARKKDYPA
jgi:hypothetical protein